MGGSGGHEISVRVVAALASAYRRQGFHSVAVPAIGLRRIATQTELEPALAALLDAGHIVPVGRNGVALHPSARLGILSARVLAAWRVAIAREEARERGLHRDNVATELRLLVDWAVAAGLPDDLAERAAELAGVLATADLDETAMTVVARHGGTPHTRLAALSTVRSRSVPDLEGLVVLLRASVSTVRPVG